MARKILTFMVDDLTNQELDGDGETVSFSLDGVDYEIDLSAENARQLREVLRPFLVAGRRTVTGRGSGRPAPRRAEDPDRQDRGKARRMAIREWAIQTGRMSPQSRGVIARSVVEEYDEAHRGR